MKRALIASTALIAAVLVTPRPASALFGAGDTVYCVNCSQEMQEVIRWGQQAADMAKQIGQMYAQYQQLVAIYGAFTRITDLNTAVAALGMVGIQNPLPVNPSAVQGLMNGTGGANGMIGSIGSLFNGTLNQNRVYETPGDTWLNRQINQSGGGLAGAQALSLQLYQSAAERLQALPELQARIGTAADPSEREALIARINVEQAYIQTAQVQAAALGNFMQAQFRVREQQREERRQQEFDEVLSQATARGHW